MAYATPEQLTLYSLAPGVAAAFSAEEQEAALDAASALVESYIRGRFDLPLADPYSLDIVTAVTDIAAYTLMKKRGFAPDTEDAKQFEGAYSRAVAWLKDVSMGKALPAGTVSDAGATQGSTAQNAPYVISGRRGSLGRPGTFYESEAECSLPAWGDLTNRRGW